MSWKSVNVNSTENVITTAMIGVSIGISVGPGDGSNPDKLLRNADLSIANLEFLFHDFEHAWQWTGGTYTRSDPKNLSELKWMGINAVLTANNHSYDFSEGGYFTTLKHLEEHDIPHAGGGKDLDHARAGRARS